MVRKQRRADRRFERKEKKKNQLALEVWELEEGLPLKGGKKSFVRKDR